MTIFVTRSALELITTKQSSFTNDKKLSMKRFIFFNYVSCGIKYNIRAYYISNIIMIGHDLATLEANLRDVILGRIHHQF